MCLLDIFEQGWWIALISASMTQQLIQCRSRLGNCNQPEISSRTFHRVRDPLGAYPIIGLQARLEGGQLLATLLAKLFKECKILVTVITQDAHSSLKINTRRLSQASQQ